MPSALASVAPVSLALIFSQLRKYREKHDGNFRRPDDDVLLVHARVPLCQYVAVARGSQFRSRFGS